MKNQPNFLLTTLQKKYQKLYSRLQKAINSGRLSRFSVSKKQQLLSCLSRYEKQLKHWGISLAASAALLLPATMLSQPTAAGSEFRVNTFTLSGQSHPSVAMDDNGNFVAVWHSNGQDGNSEGVYAQLYNQAGIAQGSEFMVNTYTTDRQFLPSVAMDSDGDFVVSWNSYEQDGNHYGIYAQRYDSDGIPQGSEFQVNTYTTGSQFDHSVAMDVNGNFIIAWQSAGQDGSGYGVYAQRYSDLGVPQGTEFQVNTYTTSTQGRPEAAFDTNGNFVIAWHRNNRTVPPADYGIYAQRYNNAGSPLGSEFQVNTYTTYSQIDPDVAMDDDGDFIVTWMSYNQDGDYYGVYAQRYNANGATLGIEFQVNTFTTHKQAQPSVAMDSDGDFLISWHSGDPNGPVVQDGSSRGVYAQAYNNNGTIVGSEFRVNTYTTADQSFPSVAMDTDGDLVIAWRSDGQDGSSASVYAQRYTVLCTPQNWYTDADGDLYGAGTPISACIQPPNTVANNTDCDDSPTGGDVNPGATEICDGIDNNCDGITETYSPDLAALIDLYNSSVGPNWTNNSGWIDGAAGIDCDPCDWYGVTCNSSGRVIGINLNNNNLNGPLPNTIDGLTYLQSLLLYNNNLTGSIPSDVGNLINLTTLRLEFNALTGSIPSSIGGLANLQYLYMSNNQLSGPIPSSLGSLNNLLVLILSNNQLNGSIPGSFGGLINCYNLAIADNQLTGAIPTQLSAMTNLGTLSLGNNLLASPIPDLSGLANLTSLQLSQNLFNGPVPTWLGNMTWLNYLFLDRNQFSGPIPGELGNLTNLSALYLFQNQLSGCYPPNLNNLCPLSVNDLLLSGNPGLPGGGSAAVWTDFCTNGTGGDADLDGFCKGIGAGYDCNDTNSNIFPGAPELCDNLDNDCDGDIDDGLYSGFQFNYTFTCVNRNTTVNITWTGGCPTWLVDISLALLSTNAGIMVVATGLPNTGSYSWTIPGTLPNDTYFFYLPGAIGYGSTFYIGDVVAPELCNSIDDDCDGQTDEGNICCPTGNVFFVNKNATGSNNGSSWADAFTDLQSALTSSCTGITEIWVAAGTYKPTTTTDRTISFVMKNNLAIYGGFIGTEALLSQRNWVNNVTILSGDIGGTGNGDNSYHVIFNNNNGLNSSALLNGFNITAGNAAGYFVIDHAGGGIYNSNASPSFTNCIISGNITSSIGGGMYNEFSSPIITNCSFLGNSTGYGGGMYNAHSTPVVTFCTFSGNSAVVDGGGILSVYYSTILTNCTISGNFAGGYGGGFCNIDNALVLTNCTFSGNSSFIGGGIFISSSINSTAVMTNCIIWGNSTGVVNYNNNSSPIYVKTLVQGLNLGTGIFSGITNPLFINQPNYNNAPTTAGDLRLQICSRAIDAGTNTGTPSNDLDGNLRPHDGNGDGTPLTDLGAYEFQGTWQTWYKDRDNDGYSDGISVIYCSHPANYKLLADLIAPPIGLNIDCNDNDATQFPGQIWYKDQDNDGYSNGTTIVQCAKPAGYKLATNLLATIGDCQDGTGGVAGNPNATYSSIHPNAPEVCNGIDDNCNVTVDEGLSSQNYIGNVILNTQAKVDNWPSCYTKITGDLKIATAGVVDLTPLINLTEVTGNVTIQTTSLQNLNGLDNLTTIGQTLLVKQNNNGVKLTSLSGLQGVLSVGANLQVTQNNILVDCCPIELLLINGGVLGTININNPMTPCNTASQILLACPNFTGGNSNNLVVVPPCDDCPIAWQEVPGMEVRLFPNPTTGELTLQFNSSVPVNGSVEIVDLYGRLLHTEILPTNGGEYRLSIATLPAGVYFVRFLEEGVPVWVQRLVKH